MYKSDNNQQLKIKTIDWDKAVQRHTLVGKIVIMQEVG
jgi:hypothetical protein